MEDNFSTDGWGGGGALVVQEVMRAKGSDGGQQVKLCLLAHCSPPAVQPGP